MSEATAPSSIDPRASLHLRSTIDADTFACLKTALVTSFYDRLLEDRRQRFLRSEHRIKTYPRIILWISLVGLALALFFALTGGLPYKGVRLALPFAAYFAFTAALSFAIPRIRQWIVKPWRPFWKAIATIHATSLLKAARKAVPFDAEYTFAGNSVTYFRTTEEVKKQVWQRQLHGHRVSGTGFSLLLKHERAIAPTLIILHQPSAELDAWFERAGCFPVAANSA